MPDLAAAIGLGQLERAETLRSQRQEAAEYYFRKLSNITVLDLPKLEVTMNEHAWHIFPDHIK